ncbi:Tryptophan 2-monooxygenase [Frankliniella fusca]|uniref:Tryptophan 2-monooxygenase n=1 Tax=Frankliniella fusca TaxID=407009 RepID=A0AAE1GY43_9NEOP|nr:Tryptophan 2-monooxygenase [Frankliniella fusca]
MSCWTDNAESVGFSRCSFLLLSVINILKCDGLAVNFPIDAKGLPDGCMEESSLLPECFSIEEDLVSLGSSSSSLFVFSWKEYIRQKTVLIQNVESTFKNTVLDYDKDRRFRLLKSLKERNIPPTYQWDLSYVLPSPKEVPSTSDECAAGLEHFDSLQSLNHSIREVTFNGSVEMLQQSNKSEENRIVKCTTDNNSSSGGSLNGSVLQLNNSTCCLYETVNVDSEDNLDEQPNLVTEFDLVAEREFISNANSSTASPAKKTPTASTIEITPTTSPAKKKIRNGDGSTDAGTKTPRKTPRKATVQNQLMWGTDATKAFVKLCVTFKEEVQMESPPVEVWKKIFNELDQLGYIPHLTWQICRSKFNYMNTFFTGTLLPNNGILSGVKWSHYDQFCTIHDIPLGYMVPDVNKEGMKADGATLWNDPDRCKMLIHQYRERYHIFKGSKSMVRHSTLYSEISGTLNMFEVPCNAKQCESKIKELEGKFRCEYDKSRKTGAAPSSWPYYKDMLEIYGGNSTLEPRFAYTVGSSQDKFLQKGKEVQEVPSTSRTRQPPAYGSSRAHSKERGPKAKVYNNKTDELKERQVTAQETIANEMMLLRTGIEVSTARRMPAIESLAASVAKLVNAEVAAKKKLLNLTEEHLET